MMNEMTTRQIEEWTVINQIAEELLYEDEDEDTGTDEDETSASAGRRMRGTRLEAAMLVGADDVSRQQEDPHLPFGTAAALATSLPLSNTGRRTSKTPLNAVQLRLLAAASPAPKKRTTTNGRGRLSKSVLPSSNRWLQAGMMKEFESNAEEMVVFQTSGSRTHKTSGPTATTTGVQVDWEAINTAIRSRVALAAPAVVPTLAAPAASAATSSFSVSFDIDDFTNTTTHAATITDAVTSRHVVEEIETLGKHDVLFGREKTAKDHEGNIRLKKLIQSYKLEYEKADYTARTEITDGIIRTVHDCGGCFLKMNRNEGYWEEVDRKAAREKITHSFRYIRNPYPNNNKNYRSLKKQIIPVARAAPAASVVPRTDATPTSAAATATAASVANQIMTTMGMCSTAVSSSPASCEAAATVATALVAKQIMTVTSSNAHFPSRLHDMLDGVERTQLTAIVSWCPDGRSFQIHQPALMLPVLGQYFRITQYKSLLRQLQAYNFQRNTTAGDRRGTVFHPHFQRGRRSLCLAMKRKVSQGRTT